MSEVSIPALIAEVISKHRFYAADDGGMGDNCYCGQDVTQDGDLDNEPVAVAAEHDKHVAELVADALESVTAPTDEERVARILAIYSPLGYPSTLALIEAQTRMLEQENIARSAPSTCEAHTTVAGDPWWGCDLTAGHGGRHVYGKRLYGAYPEYGIEAAPSDTDPQTINLDAARLLLDTWSGEDDQRLFADVNWQLIRANYRSLLEAAHLTNFQPVQVEVTDEMVGRAGRAMYATWDEWSDAAIEDGGIGAHVRAVLEAALGGDRDE